MVWRYFGVRVEPQWLTKRRVPGGTCIDVRVTDPCSTLTWATVNLDNLRPSK